MSSNKVFKSQSDIYDEFIDKDNEQINSNKTNNNNNNNNNNNDDDDDDVINSNKKNGEVLAMLPTIDEFFNAIKFGLNSQVTRLLDLSPDFLNSVDAQGFSAIHWASKRGDITLLNILGERNVIVDKPTTFDARMHPIHWAASDGKIVSLRFLLDRRADINAQDGNGCTAVIIASQHNHTSCVNFLIRNGADMSLRDNNGDTALHWAAYKGFVEMTGLLSYSCPESLNVEDTYGQTPLHLSALRGNEEVVEYLVTDCHADVSKKDRNGLTPLDLSIKKSQLKCEWTLRRLAAKSKLGIIKNLGLNHLRNPKILSFLCIGSNEREVSYWPWRIVFASNFLASVTTIMFALDVNLADLYYLHLSNIMFQILWWICFLSCLFVNPGDVLDSKPIGMTSLATIEEGDQICGNNYQECLEFIGRSVNEVDHPPLCHTCHIRRPLRSKHCKMLRKCVHKFDHFCPFVGNTVGRDNYKFFIGLLVCHIICSTLWTITTIYLSRRSGLSWSMLFYVVYATLWSLMIYTLFHYHVTLMVQNLTTNEHINLSKYAYLKNAFNVLDNPFDQGSVWGNIKASIFPLSYKSYFHRQDVLDDKYASQYQDQDKHNLL